jgi:hypothetical protein
MFQGGGNGDDAGEPSVGMPVGSGEEEDGVTGNAADQRLGDVQPVVAALQIGEICAVGDVEDGGFVQPLVGDDGSVGIGDRQVFGLGDQFELPGDDIVDEPVARRRVAQGPFDLVRHHAQGNVDLVDDVGGALAGRQGEVLAFRLAAADVPLLDLLQAEQRGKDGEPVERRYGEDQVQNEA